MGVQGADAERGDRRHAAERCVAADVLDEEVGKTELVGPALPDVDLGQILGT